MTNVIRLLVVLSCLLIALIVSQCADPLDITNQPVPPNQNPIDTTFMVDTVYVIDTVTRTQFDTTFIVDTVLQNRIDTVTLVDTVIQTRFDTTYVIDTVNHSHIDTVLVVDTVTQNYFDTTYVVDTVFRDRIDTLLLIDTVLMIDHDTVSIVDTVYQVDTLRVVDTVYVTNDTSQMMCGRIESCQKEIIWLLQNTPGSYHLSFAAVLEKNQPPQSLTLQIGSSSYSWNTASSTMFTVDASLDANSSIIITSQKPPARGHAVYICLSITRQ